jgi:hypothetical protein
MLIATDEETCLVVVLRQLFLQDSQSINALLFRLIDEVFIRIAVIKKLKIRLTQNDIDVKFYTRHSFRKDVAQHASDNEMLDENIQRLGR